MSFLTRIVQNKANSAPAPSVVTVGVAATLLAARDPGRLAVMLRNTAAATDVFIGYSSAITTANAPIKLVAGAQYTETLAGTEMYGVVAAGTATVVVQILTP